MDHTSNAWCTRTMGGASKTGYVALGLDLGRKSDGIIELDKILGPDSHCLSIIWVFSVLVCVLCTDCDNLSFQSGHVVHDHVCLEMQLS
jgi:hypothetical protein